jgi:predicted transposase YdaD
MMVNRDGAFDALLKQLVDDFAPDFAAWLLDSEVESIAPLTLDLPAETLATDTLFCVWLPDGRSILLHIEFQGRRSHRPMPERMLDYGDHSYDSEYVARSRPERAT